jgi:hypothetical protein
MVLGLADTKRHWQDFPNHLELRKFFMQFGRQVRGGHLDVGREHYALTLAVGVWQAISCGHNKLAAVEMGVAGGAGLLSLCQAAAFFRDVMDMDIRVYGFDNATGLPKLHGYKDHPELWQQGEFLMHSEARLREKLPDFAELIIGDVADTIPAFHARLQERPLGFVSIDVDLYTSTVACFAMMDWEPACYLPAVPCYFDDMEEYVTYNDWCGEELAIREFNEAHPMRKFQRHPKFNIRHFFCLHVLDHRVRSGEETPVFPLRIGGL